MNPSIEARVPVGVIPRSRRPSQGRIANGQTRASFAGVGRAIHGVNFIIIASPARKDVVRKVDLRQQKKERVLGSAADLYDENRKLCMLSLEAKTPNVV